MSPPSNDGSLLVEMLLEALGREISGDAPLVATCVGAAAVVDCEPAAGAEEAPRVAISRRGSPDGRIAHELVYLLRVLQHSSGKAWTQVVGKCLYAALQLAPNAVECLRGEGATGDEAHDEALPEVASRATWLVLGTLSVCGGHVDGIQPGSRVLLRTEGSRALASVLDANSTSARVIIHAPPLPLISRRLDLDDLLPTPEIEPSVAGLPLQQLLPQIAALLPTRPTQRSTLTEVAMGTATPAPLLGVIHSRAAKAIHVLLAGTTHAEVATALLGSAAFPRLLDLATTSVPYFQPAKGSRAQLGFTEALALELDATLLDAMPAAADVRSTLRGARCTVPTLRLGVHLADELTDEDHLLDLCALGLAPTTCAEALSASGGHVIDAAHRLLNVNDAAGAGEAEKQNSALIAQLEAMGFPYELCAYSLNRAANDLQRAAEYLLEGGQLPEGTSHASGGSGSRGGGDRSAQASESASGGGSTPFQPGVPVELNDEADPSRWHEAQVLECTEHAVKVSLVGWCAEWSEWVPISSARLRAATGLAIAGPLAARATERRADGGSSSGGGTPVAASADGSAPTASSSGTPIGESAAASPRAGARSGGWFSGLRSGASSSKRRTAAEPAASSAACPTPAADFVTSDTGLSRVVDRETGPAPLPEPAAGLAVRGQRVRLTAKDTPHTHRVGIVLADAEEGAPVSVLVAGEDAFEARLQVAPNDMETPQQRLGRVAPALGAKSLTTLQRLGCALHDNLAVLHCRQAALTMLCEFGWLRTADEDEACSFALKDLDGLLAPIVRLLKLTCVAEPCADDHAADSDALNMVCATLSNLLTDTALLEGAPSFQALPSMLGYECVRFLARAATSAQHAESSHPSECADRIVPLACPGASSMHLQFDCRTWLSRGSTLGVYLDVGCTQEVFSFDADDLIASETLVVPVERVWLKYHAHQNRDNAWGFKVHAQPARWRVCNEVALVEGPFEFGWELLQLLVEEAPPVIAEPELLANLLRYVLHGRAPHKERACLLLLKALPHVHLGEPPFDHAVFLAIEQHVGWHDMLLKQHLPLEGTALLPCATQCMLDLLVECRERLTSMSPPAPWISSLPCMSEVSELSALTKWLLMPSEYACPRTSLRLAARSSGEQSVDPRAYDKWTTSLDAQLVDLVSKAHHGSSALNLRATQIATISEAAREASSTIRAWSHGQVSMRLGLLQRFNQLLTRNIATVHTGMPRKLETLGGRLCMLRGAILLETKLNALEQALASTVSDVDATPVVLNRFKASRLRARAEADHSGVGTLFVQLQEQLGRIKPRALFRHDKAFRANLSGENADDHGGPYREALAHIVTELQSDALPLLIRCPNGQNGVGEHRDTYVPNPSATSSVHMEWYYFLGQLFGLALRQKETQLGLSLPSVVWKQLVAEGMDGSDLANFDAMCKQSLDKLRDIDKEGVDAELFADVIFETFTTQLSDGSEVALLPNGSAIDVTFDNRHEFCDAVRQARLHEAQHQCDAILQGLSYVVPQRVLTLFTWQQLELLTCGSKEIDLEMLRTKTKYGVGVSPSQRHVRYLWQTLRRFSPENRALFLRFVWGRTRLPATPGEWGDVRFTLHTRHSGSPDNSYPVAHTCFFSLELPAYTSLATCHEKILYAITNCQNIDIDTTTSARENRERGVEEDDGDDGAGPSAIDEVRI